MTETVTREKFYEYIRLNKETSDKLTTETHYYLQLFDKYYQPQKPVPLFISWNWAGLLGMFWFAYRKMYLIAFILFILPIAPFGPFSALLGASLGNSLYLRHVIKAIERNDISAKGQNDTLVWLMIIFYILLSILYYVLTSVRI